MDLWQITYTNIITGSRQTYMDVGFRTPELAKEEIERLMRDAKKYRKQYHNVNEMFQNNIRIPSSMIGKYWRVKKLKIKES